MKKTLFLLSLSITTPLLSQTARAQSFIGLTAGISSPIGNFSKGDYSDPKSGFAGTGANIGLTGVYFIKKSHFGIAALLSYHGYGFKGGQSLADGYKEDFDIDSSTVNIKGSNRTLSFLVGPYYAIPICKRFTVDVRLMVGISSTHLAGNEVYIEDQTGNNFGQLEASATGFGWQLGIAPHIDISSHWGVMLNLDYFNSNPTFTIENENRQNVAGRLIQRYHQPIQGFNTNLTFAYIF